MINKGIVNQLIKTYNSATLEKHLIYSFVKDNKIDFDSSPILKSYFSNFKLDSRLLFETSVLNISNIKELENYLELIIPEKDRKLNGAFFTPEYIVDYIIEKIHPGKKETSLDPSCGCGAFLIGLVKYYRKTYKLPIRKIIRENIYGADILDYNIRRAKLIIAIYALQNNEIIHESDFNFYHGDSLRRSWEVSFDNIVGNPPYVKFQDLSIENRQYLSENWSTIKSGSFNIYFAFFELGYKLLNPKGRLGFITPNNYFTSFAGEALRKFFQGYECITRIVDFNHKKIFDAQTYTAITFLNKQRNKTIIYDRIEDGQNPQSFLNSVNGSHNRLKKLSYKKWRLLKSDEQDNINIIETAGAPIGKLFDISVGIATLKDDVFFVNGEIEKNGFFIKSTESGVFEIEKEVLKPVYKISDFKSQEEIRHNKRKIICPYTFNNGVAKAIPEEELKYKYPKCYNYLLSEKDKLKMRDKGKIAYNPFYVWGRTQGLLKRGKKILNPTFSQHPRFLIVEEEDAYFTNGYGIYFHELETDYLFANLINPIARPENIDVIQKILNSFVMDYYISKTSVAIEGGYPCYQKNFIEKFTIPELSDNEIETLRRFTDKNEIDDFLIRKYHLKIPAPNLLSYIESKSSINPE